MSSISPLWLPNSALSLVRVAWLNRRFIASASRFKSESRRSMPNSSSNTGAGEVINTAEEVLLFHTYAGHNTFPPNSSTAESGWNGGEIHQRTQP